MKTLKTLFLGVLSVAIMQGCSEEKHTDQTDQSQETNAPEAAPTNDPMANKGIGPVTSITLAAEIDQAMATKGQEIYNAKCTACHKPTEKMIGPAHAGILDRRSPEWVMNMILNPEEMIQRDPMAKVLKIEFDGAQMTNQNLTHEEARSVLEYFRTL